MIYIFMALYCEAHPFIQSWKFKQNSEIRHFQVFENEELNMVLTITGVGSVAAAAAVASICTKYGAGKEDFLMNIGICAQITERLEGQKKIYLCNKITEAATGKIFYPDMLYRHKFLEGAITTVMNPIQIEEGVSQNEMSGRVADTGLYDMEAAAVYQAGACFVGPHQMSFIKIVSDRGEVRAVTPQKAEECICKNFPAITEYVDRFARNQRADRQENGQNIRENLWIEKVCEDMHCSVAMKNAMKQQIHYCRLAGIDYKKILKDGYQQGKLPCGSKREGKQYFEEFRKQLF